MFPRARESGDPGHIALPAVWRASLDRLFSAGLQAEAMLNAITMMMDREDVPTRARSATSAASAGQRCPQTTRKRSPPASAHVSHSGVIDAGD